MCNRDKSIIINGKKYRRIHFDILDTFTHKSSRWVLNQVIRYAFHNRLNEFNDSILLLQGLSEADTPTHVRVKVRPRWSWLDFPILQHIPSDLVWETCYCFCQHDLDFSVIDLILRFFYPWTHFFSTTVLPWSIILKCTHTFTLTESCRQVITAAVTIFKSCNFHP